MGGLDLPGEMPSAGGRHAPDASCLGAWLQQCVHCGMCLAVCPTYSLFGTEMDNPRGRIAMLRGVARGRVQAGGSFGLHIDRCLGCMACVAVCPSGVEYARLLESAHAIAREAHRPGPTERFIRWLGMKQLMPHVGRLRSLALLVTLYQVTGLQWLLHRLRVLPPGLRAAEALLPPRPFRPPTRASVSTQNPLRGRAGLFTGCMQEAFLGDVNGATLRVLERNGYQVVIPPQQTCCGALQRHEGERVLTAELAKMNIDAFLEADVDVIIVNAGGCGPVLREYPLLLQDDPEYAQRARQFGERLRDVSEFLVEQGVDPPQGRLPLRVTYSDSCHLRNEMGVIQQPREVLRSIPDLEFVELARPDQCCGSAGVYNLLHAEIADQVLEAKLADIDATGAQVVVVTNPGCHLQIAAGVRRAGLNVRVLHLVELLDEAYAAERQAPC